MRMTVMYHLDKETSILVYTNQGGYTKSEDYPVIKLGEVTLFPTEAQIEELYARCGEYLKDKKTVQVPEPEKPPSYSRCWVCKTARPESMEPVPAGTMWFCSSECYRNN